MFGHVHCSVCNAVTNKADRLQWYDPYFGETERMYLCSACVGMIKDHLKYLERIRTSFR